MTKIIIANIKEKLNQQQYVKKKYFVQMKKLLLQMTPWEDIMMINLFNYANVQNINKQLQKKGKKEFM